MGWRKACALGRGSEVVAGGAKKTSFHLLYETGQAQGTAEGEGEGEIKYISRVNSLRVCGHRRSEENENFPRDLQNAFSDVTGRNGEK